MKPYSFNTRNTPTLDVAAGSDVAISVGQSNQVTVEIDGEDSAINLIEVKQSGDTISIVDKSSSGNAVSMSFSNGSINMSGGSFQGVSMIGNNIHISGGSGSVFVNGKRVDLDVQSDSKTLKKTLISIRLPQGSDLEATMQNEAKLACAVDLSSAFVMASGCSEVIFSAKSIELTTSGSSEARVVAKGGGDINLTASGSSEINLLNGSFLKAKVSSSGSSDVTTNGTCLGDYTANASGSSSIKHRGSISGKARSHESGCASVRL